MEKLSDRKLFQDMFHISRHDIPMPSIDDLKEIIELLRSVLFPGYFRNQKFILKLSDTIQGQNSTEFTEASASRLKGDSAFPALRLLKESVPTARINQELLQNIL